MLLFIGEIAVFQNDFNMCAGTGSIDYRPDVIDNIFILLRFQFADIDVVKVADIQKKKIMDLSNNSEEDINDLPGSNVLQYFLEDGSKITMRPSGTEPKIKFYFSVNKKATEENVEQVREELGNKIELLKKDLLVKIDSI